MNPTPETTGYLLLGLVVVFTVLTLYVGSLSLRFRNNQQTLQTLDRLEIE